MLTLLIVVTVLAGVGWLAHWCAEDKINDQAAEIRELRAENTRLRATVIATSPHPAAQARRDRAVGEPLFADTLRDIQDLPEINTTLVLNEDDETVEWGGPA